MTSQTIWDGPFTTSRIDLNQQRMNKTIDLPVALQPIDARQQSQVFSATLDCIRRASAIYRLDLAPIRRTIFLQYIPNGCNPSSAYSWSG